MNNFNNFAAFQIDNQTANNIKGGTQSWAQIKNQLTDYRGATLANSSIEAEVSYNMFTGTMENSGTSRLTLEFNDGTAISIHIQNDCIDSYISRLDRMFS